jgi:hydroxyacylglutathione hydrolase
VSTMPEVILIKLSVSNAYLVKDRQAVLVDAGAPNEADRILAAVRKAGVEPGDISLILHTHGHIDHAGSTAELKRRLKIPIAVHASDAFMLRTGTNGEIKPRNWEARLVKAMLVKPFEAVEPDLIIEQESSYQTSAWKGRCSSRPATPGVRSRSCSATARPSSAT